MAGCGLLVARSAGAALFGQAISGSRMQHPGLAVCIPAQVGNDCFQHNFLTRSATVVF